jgi:hypothetical protein
LATLVIVKVLEQLILKSDRINTFGKVYRFEALVVERITRGPPIEKDTNRARRLELLRTLNCEVDGSIPICVPNGQMFSLGPGQNVNQGEFRCREARPMERC